MSDQFGKQAIFVLPDGEKITVQLVGEPKLQRDKPDIKIVAVWGPMKA